MMTAVCAATGLLLGPSAAPTLARGQVHRERSFVPPALVGALRSEIRQRKFNVAESFSSDGQQDDLRSAFTCKPDINEPAFSVLYDMIDDVRLELQSSLGPLSPGVEASFVVYPPDGFYKRHIDSLGGVDAEGSGRRRVSFICYLTESKRAWTHEDGGALRCFRGEDTDEFFDVLPESGSLVLFDSKLVWHEVRPTRRERTCLVGWFRSA